MSGALGPGHSSIHPGPRHHALERRTHAQAAQLLVVDPAAERWSLVGDLAKRGVNTTVTGSTIDGLVAFGRSAPAAVIVAPTAVGIPPAVFVQTIRRLGSPYVVAVLDRHDGPDVRDLQLAGTSAVIERPYDAETIWDLLRGSPWAFDDDPRVSFGPLELDVRSFEVKVRGERIHDLPLKEFELLRALLSRAPEVVSNDELRAAAWGETGSQTPDNTLAVHVTRLRGRLQGVARIRRVRGRGYALATD